MNSLLTICVITPLLVLLCYQDCKHRQLPNTYTLALAVLGLLWRLGLGGVAGVLDGLLGGITGALFLLLPFLLKGAGGGDLKMIFATGIFTGFRFCCAAMLFISFSGLILGLVLVLLGQVDASRLKHLLRTIFDWRYDRQAALATLPPRQDEKVRVPFGVAIAIGTIATLLYSYFQGYQL